MEVNRLTKFYPLQNVLYLNANMMYFPGQHLTRLLYAISRMFLFIAYCTRIEYLPSLVARARPAAKPVVNDSNAASFVDRTHGPRARGDSMINVTNNDTTNAPSSSSSGATAGLVGSDK